MKVKVKLAVVPNDERVEALKKEKFDFAHQDSGYYEDVVITIVGSPSDFADTLTIRIARGDFNRLLSTTKEVDGDLLTDLVTGF